FQIGNGLEMGEAPPCAAELERLPDLPCFHPCSPLPGQGHQGADGDWPSNLPAQTVPVMPPANDKNDAAPTPAPEQPSPPKPENAPLLEAPVAPVPPPVPLQLRESSQQRLPAGPSTPLPDTPRQTPRGNGE